MAEQNMRVGRVAFREKGSVWVAYWAQDDTMEGAHKLGSIKMSLVANPERKQQFMNLMRECAADVIESSVGVRPEFGGPETAPGHERMQ
ncbi:MAG: hypothetical protein V2I66_08135 [Halieaceae bacterium]|jgi:hypothetical protein|nr:hypothetical protein [Halieaceae bacterium]